MKRFSEFTMSGGFDGLELRSSPSGFAIFSSFSLSPPSTAVISDDEDEPIVPDPEPDMPEYPPPSPEPDPGPFPGNPPPPVFPPPPIGGPIGPG